MTWDGSHNMAWHVVTVHAWNDREKWNWSQATQRNKDMQAHEAQLWHCITVMEAQRTDKHSKHDMARDHRHSGTEGTT